VERCCRRGGYYLVTKAGRFACGTTVSHSDDWSVLKALAAPIPPTAFLHIKRSSCILSLPALLHTCALATKHPLQRWRMALTTFDIVVLSSSPPENAWASATAAAPQSLSPSPLSNTHRVGMPAPSPLQLSPRVSPLRKSAGALKTGSRAATMPEGALRGFATARSLVADCEDEELQEFDWGLIGKGKAADEQRKGTRQSAKLIRQDRAAGGDAEVPKPKPRVRKPKVDKGSTKLATARKRAHAPTESSHFATSAAIDAVDALDDPPAKTKTTKPRKSRAKKTPADGETQTTIKKAKVTKPRSSTKAAKAAREKTSLVVSAHFGDTTDIDGPKTTTEALVGDDSIWDVPMSPSGRKKGPPIQQPIDDKPLELDEAITRRRDWTPIRDTEPLYVLTESAGKENESAAVVGDKDSFTSLLSGYSYTRLDPTFDATTSISQMPERKGITKRRRVEVCLSLWCLLESLMLMLIAACRCSGEPSRISSIFTREGESTQEETPYHHRSCH
jgi:hypothetical protein